jgi:hypothetical protein
MSLAAIIVGAVLAADGMQIVWDKNYLVVSADGRPGGDVRIHYLEAYLRSGSTNQDWRKSMIPHKTRKVSATSKRIELQCRVEPSVVVDHVIEAGKDDVTFTITAKNEGDSFVDVQWAQPCMRVDKFMGMTQDDYFHRCFIFTERGATLLHETKRTDKALYIPGQVYVPAGIPLADVNPRPISPEKPVNGLIGCYSKDGKTLLATAFDSTQELFQGVAVCIHADFRIGGLKPQESRTIRGKLYWLSNDIPGLLRRYEKDFPSAKAKKSS